MSKIKFQPIDLRTLPRGEMFYYFSKMAPTGYSLTVSMDVTKLRQTLKEAGLKFFPAYLWLITKNLNQQMEFKMAIQEETLGYFNSLPPLLRHLPPRRHRWLSYPSVPAIPAKRYGYLFPIYQQCSQMMMPLQWSISCWMTSATQPENLCRCCFQEASRYSTSISSYLVVFRVPVKERQPSSAS